MAPVDDTRKRPPGVDGARRRRVARRAVFAGSLVVAVLPLAGLASLLLRSRLDPHIENYRLHFVVFGIVGGTAFLLGYAAGEAANRRGDARVLLLSLAFMATGGSWGSRARDARVLFVGEHGGFHVAIPVGLLVSAVFATASAFVDLRPDLAPWLIRRRTLLRGGVLPAMGAWFVWAAARLPRSAAGSEAATDGARPAIAVVGTVMYAVSAVRYWTSSGTAATCWRSRSSHVSCCSRRRSSASPSPASGSGMPAGGSGTA